jgi:hypothetical protein
MTEHLHPDILAMTDVLEDMVEATDSLDVEGAIIMRESIVELRRKAGVLLGLIDTQLISILESPREFGGQRYRVANEGKWLPYHDKVVAEVKKRAVVDLETGEMRSPGEAAEAAIKLMADCYVSPSGFPKTGALERMGLEKSDVGRFDGKGKKIAVEPVKGEVKP